MNEFSGYPRREQIGFTLLGNISDHFEACEQCGASWSRLHKEGTPLFRVDPSLSGEIQFICEECQ